MVDLFRRNALEKSVSGDAGAYAGGVAPSPEEPRKPARDPITRRQHAGRAKRKTREAFLLSQLDGLTYSEIAHKLGVSVSSVKKYVAKAVEHCLLFRLEHGLRILR